MELINPNLRIGARIGGQDNWLPIIIGEIAGELKRPLNPTAPAQGRIVKGDH
jgi:hypothetical protein